MSWFWGMSFVLCPSNHQHSIDIVNDNSSPLVIPNIWQLKSKSVILKSKNHPGIPNPKPPQGSCKSTPICSNSSYYKENFHPNPPFQYSARHTYLRSTVPVLTLILWLCLCKCFQVMFNQVCQFVQDLRSFQWTFWGPNWEGIFSSFDSSFHLKKQKNDHEC